MILLVGDKPSPKMKPEANPFEGAACEGRLKEWVEVLGLDVYCLTNSYGIKDTRFINRMHVSYKATIVALGNNASKRLTSINIPHFKLPHPSGRNRQINDRAFIASRLDECKKYIEEKTKV